MNDLLYCMCGIYRVVKTVSRNLFFISSGYTCPTCNESLVDMSSYWSRLDSTIAQTPMPAEYANLEVKASIICCKIIYPIIALLGNILNHLGQTVQVTRFSTDLST